MIKKDVIIIGSGPSGLTAGIYSARADFETVIVAGNNVGGQLMNTTLVENFPGFSEGVMGPELMQNMLKQAENQGAEFIYNIVSKIDFTESIKKVWIGEQEYQSPVVILATGSSPRKLGIPGEDRFYGKGVSVCATCDGAFYKDKVIAVVGGGDSALEEATFLTKFASKVYLIHRRDEFRASKAMQERALANKKIEVIWNTDVKEVLGDDGVVSGLKLFNKVEETDSEIEVAGMFLAVGHIPNTQFLGDAVELDDHGFVVATNKTYTSVEGVFVAGDVNDHLYQQAITAAGMGCMAALDAEKWIAGQK